MVKRFLLGAVLASVIALPAWANHCPLDIKAIDHAMAKMSLPAATMTQVKALRDQGEALHKAGKHKESTDVLSKAMRMILESQ